MQMNTTEQITEITPRQLELLEAIAGFIDRRCYSPTIGELGSQLGVSRSTAFEHISELRRKGLLGGATGKSRSLRPTLKAHELLEKVGRQTQEKYEYESGGIRLAGRVAAGAPIEAIEDNRCLSIESYFGCGDDLFALEVSGDSMVGVGIQDGDYVICRHARTAENGQLVVAIVDEENATLKRFYKEKDRIRLQPANQEYEPIYSDNCRIEAVVVGLVRQL